MSDDLRAREDDVIWRVRWGQDWLYVYLLLEFQPTVDRFMAVGVMTYLGGPQPAGGRHQGEPIDAVHGPISKSFDSNLNTEVRPCK